MKTILEGITPHWASRPQNPECHPGGPFLICWHGIDLLAHLNSKSLLKQKMGRCSMISFPAFIPQDVIFGKAKPYLSRRRDSGSSPVA